MYLFHEYIHSLYVFSDRCIRSVRLHSSCSTSARPSRKKFPIKMIVPIISGPIAIQLLSAGCRRQSHSFQSHQADPSLMRVVRLVGLLLACHKGPLIITLFSRSSSILGMISKIITDYDSTAASFGSERVTYLDLLQRSAMATRISVLILSIAACFT